MENYLRQIIQYLINKGFIEYYKTKTDNKEEFINKIKEDISFIQKEMRKEDIYKELFDNKKMVTYLKHTVLSSYYENEMYLEAFDHYSNGCKVRYMLPNLGYTVDDLLNSDIFLKKVFYNSADVIVSVPKFEVSSELNIAKTLQALGVTNIFDPFKATISALYGENTFVSSIRQNAKTT